MTRERIIHGLYRGDSKAIKEAIKALEQQPCEDTISRADAVRVASGYCHPANVAKELAKLPPVTPKQKVGHWVESNYGNMISQHRWYCSECGGMHHDAETGKWREVFDFKYAYCPLCGCRMVEPQESENGNEL